MNEAATIDFGSNIDEPAMPLERLGKTIDTPPPPRAPEPYQGPRVRIVLNDNDNIPPTGLFLGHNGRGFMLRAGEAVDVPPELIGILNDAVWAAPVVDPGTQQIIGYRPRLRFPYKVLAPGAME